MICNSQIVCVSIIHHHIKVLSDLFEIFQEIFSPWKYAKWNFVLNFSHFPSPQYMTAASAATAAATKAAAAVVVFHCFNEDKWLKSPCKTFSPGKPKHFSSILGNFHGIYCVCFFFNHGRTKKVCVFLKVDKYKISMNYGHPNWSKENLHTLFLNYSAISLIDWTHFCPTFPLSLFLF